MTAPPVTFYFGAASRYSYLAASRLDAMTARTGARFDWVPLDVLRLLELRGRSPFSPTPASEQYEASWRRQDAERWAALYGMPFLEPVGRLALDMRLLARACTVASTMGAATAYGQAMMNLVFAIEGSTVDEGRCIELARDGGLDVDRFRSQLAGDASARRVEDIARTAQSQGVFGAPSFVVDGLVFWGNDRLPLLEHHLLGRPNA